MTRLFARSLLLQLITLCTAFGVLWAPVAEAAEAADGPEMEEFFTFTWGGFGRQQAGQRGGKPRGGQQPRGKSGKPGGKPKGKPRGPKPGGAGKAKTYQSRPEKKDRIDPDNPFAQALKGLTDKK